MTKKYRLLIDSPEYAKDTIATQDPDGDYVVIFGEEGTGVRQYLNKKQIENRPEVWELIEEPKQSFKRWRAEYNKKYWVVTGSGEVCSSTESRDKYCDYYYLTGNYFQTEQEAEAYKARQEAIGRVTHAIIEANEGWEPDYSSDNAFYNVVVEHGMSVNRTLCRLQFPVLFPPCKTEDIALSIISSHKEDLDLIFNLK